MRSAQQQSARPGGGAVRSWLSRRRQMIAAMPLPTRVAMIALLVVLSVPLASILLVAALGYAPYALVAGERSPAATASVAIWGLVVVSGLVHGAATARYLFVALPIVVAVLAHIGSLGRWHVPCRTAAWAMAWSLPIGILIFRIWQGQPLPGPAMAWLIALVVLGWRLAKALQETEHSRASGLGAITAPYPVPAGGAATGGAAAGGAATGGGSAASPGALADVGPGRLAGPTADASVWDPASSPVPVRAAQTVSGLRSLGGGLQPGGASAAQWGQITVEEAVAELNAMIGLTAVKEQIRSITASVEAARRRALAGHGTDKPMQHFVFLGPPGTGKTAVARIVAKIFYAFGLLETPAVVEAQRADLVGEYLGATAIKTNDLVNSALGGVLFIDEAYSLVNDSDGQGDRFGSEAVQALVKRAEDDRERLIIVLAGYERQMESFLASNPGLNSRFGMRIKFPGYSPEELMALAEKAVRDKGELLDPDARPVLRHMFEEIGRRRLADELGNARFVRTLLARAGQQRDVRVMAGQAGADGQAGTDVTDLVTLRGEDLTRAYAELTTRFRGYADTPTVEGALAELDALVGLEPVKRQVHEIVAQLQVARLRDRQGLASQPPSRHFVFTGPPGTGKTTVARILGRIFAALGLLVRPEVIEAHRADLVGEHLGSTAIKTSRLIDSAMGGVLFIDEAYALHNEAYAGGDAFGAEAVATLLKRAEDERERLVIVLAGYTADMDRLLRSNPGLASRFSTRISFPSYTAAELAAIATSIAARRGDVFDAAAKPVLSSIFGQAVEEGRIDTLGNGRFARSLYERACASRDVRVALQGDAATTADLTTVLADDLLAAYRELAG